MTIASTITYTPHTQAQPQTKGLPGPHIWLLDVSQLDEALAAHYQQLLSDDELARAQIFRRGQREFIACRALVRLCLAHYTGADPRALTFEKNASGKPLLAGEHAHWQFNLSHTGTYAALAVMANGPIGIDIEQPRKRQYLAIAEQYFHEQELAFLQALPAVELQREFFRLWTLKEAFFKALGGGIATGLSRLCLRWDKQENGETGYHDREKLHHSFAADLGEAEQDWQLHQQLLTPELYLALAWRAPASTIHWFDGQQLFSELTNV